MPSASCEPAWYGAAVHPTDALAEAGRFLHARGWVPATSGNLSVRDGDGFFVTTSGRHKGRLVAGDFLRIGPHGPTPDQRPSAETALHAGLYRAFGEACGAVLHTHSPHATVLSRVFPEGVVVSGHEIGKAFPGVGTHEATLPIPVFPNDQDIDRLWRAVEPRLLAPHPGGAGGVGRTAERSGNSLHTTHPRSPPFEGGEGRLEASEDPGAGMIPSRTGGNPPPRVPGFLIAGHGLYAWGRTVDDALRHVEAFEHLFSCVVLEATLRSAR